MGADDTSDELLYVRPRRRRRLDHAPRRTELKLAAGGRSGAHRVRGEPFLQRNVRKLSAASAGPKVTAKGAVHVLKATSRRGAAAAGDKGQRTPAAAAAAAVDITSVEAFAPTVRRKTAAQPDADGWFASTPKRARAEQGTASPSPTRASAAVSAGPAAASPGPAAASPQDEPEILTPLRRLTPRPLGLGLGLGLGMGRGSVSERLGLAFGDLSALQGMSPK
jgi:hypothetical protein